MEGKTVEWLRAAQLFVGVVQSGSLSSAGRKVGLSPASVSRHINALEEALGGRLLNRTSRKLTLTEAGETYYAKLEQILQQITEANATVAQLQSAPRGNIRVHSRMLVGNLYLVPALPEFIARYPDIRIDLTLSNYPVDLVEHNIDVDIRIGKLSDSSLIARKLAGSRRLVCATPEYLARHRAITHPTDLAEHNCLTYRLNVGPTIWRFLDADGGALVEVPVSGSLQANNGEALRIAMLGGLGIALMPDWSVRHEIAAGRLVNLFPEYAASHVEFDNGIYAVFQPTRHLATKVRVFIDYIAAYFKAELGGSSEHCLTQVAHRQSSNAGQPVQ
jgi:DNA-binding transcriptional LysR family regulator